LKGEEILNVKVVEFKDALSLLTSVISKNGLRPITELVQMSAKNNKLSLGMTDNITKIALQIGCIDDLDTIVLNVEQLFKLVKLTTKEDITINIKDEIVVIKGNGTYKQSIKTDEVGARLLLSITFPKVEKLYDIDLSVYKQAMGRNKIALYTQTSEDGKIEHPELYRYYSNINHTITSDSNIIAITNSDITLQNIYEIYPTTLVDLANLNCKAKYAVVNNGIYIQADGLYYFTIGLKDNLFPIGDIKPFIDIKDSINIKFDIDKKEIKDSIKRLDIFDTNIFDIPTVCLTTKDGCVILKDTAGRAEEETEAKSNMEFSIKLSTQSLLKILPLMNDTITVYIGDGVAVLEDSIGQYIIGEVE
jgi:DNA polymerase III sliding clamp (beta) subunit (PCNA family)